MDQADVPSAPAPGMVLAERFELREVLGGGGTGTVYAAFDRAIGQMVAIKLLHRNLRDERTRERLRREVTATRPGHANLATVFDIHEADSRVFLSMELVEARSLRELLVDQETLEVGTVVAIGRQVAAALEHLHSRGVVHRDVKPGNILVAADGTAKLCDLGLARPLEKGVTVTETEMVVGTPAFMAPEQATGEELTSASDVYALGLTLFSCLTGEVPLTRPTALATLSRRLSGRPPSVRRSAVGCPRWLDRLLFRMLEPLPRDRPSAGTVLLALERQKLRPKPRRRHVIATAVVALAAAAVGAGGWFIADRPTARVDVGESEIVGRDDRGRITWQRTFTIPVDYEKRADLDGDGADEIIVGLQQRDASSSRTINTDGPEVWIFDTRGRVITRFLPEEKAPWPFPFDKELGSSAAAVDLDHDGRPEVVLVCKHMNFFPAVVFSYWPADDRWDTVLTHSGNIYDVGPIPDEARSGLRFLATNNLLGVLPFVGEVEVVDPGRRDEQSMMTKCLGGPPQGALLKSDRYEWAAYAPIYSKLQPNRAPGSRLVSRVDGSVEVVDPMGRSAVLDVRWNPVPGPNAGRDLRVERLHFMERLYQFSASYLVRDAEAVLDSRSRLQERCAALMTEDPYRLVLDVLSARAVARTGDRDNAAAILRETTSRTGSIESTYWLAGMEAADGNWEEARRLLAEIVRSDEVGTRKNFDGPQLMLRVAIETRDEEGVGSAVTQLSRMGVSERTNRLRAALGARARLWWDEVQPQDMNVESRGYAPAGAAVACLARWRRGQSRVDDAEAMRVFAEEFPDVAIEGRLARAAALLASGRAAISLDELSLLCEELLIPARVDFANLQNLQLARALRVVALEAAGEVGEAREEGAALRSELTPDLLPSILVGEVLQRTVQ